MDNKKKGLLDRIQSFLDSSKGRILLNYLYSWGAAVVILGALFKLTHIKGADLMLFVGMGTEVLVFFISGFEKPFIPGESDAAEEDYVPAARPSRRSAAAPEEFPAAGIPAAVTDIPSGQVAAAAQAQPFAGSIDTTGLDTDTQSYLEGIRELTAKIHDISMHTDRISSSTDEIETLSRNLISINTFYEMHLKSASTQMQNIEKVQEQTTRMVEQIEELNRAYARMVEAMKANSNIG